MSGQAQTEFDVIIVGGGLVGASLACALADTTLRIAIVEAQPFTNRGHPGFDALTVALSYGSREIFSAMSLIGDILVVPTWMPVSRIWRQWVMWSKPGCWARSSTHGSHNRRI